ncbi:MAG: hypothetical protein ACK5MU_04075 [Candidatus Saccharimonadales bacterium]
MSNKKPATEQAKGSPINGVVPPVDKQFGKPGGNPRSSGTWDKRHTYTYQYGRFMAMSEEEFRAWDKDTPMKDRTMAEVKAWKIVNDERLEVAKEIEDRLTGKPKQAVDVTSGDEKITGVNISFGSKESKERKKLSGR